jgi:hypothetical protein
MLELVLHLCCLCQQAVKLPPDSKHRKRQQQPTRDEYPGKKTGHYAQRQKDARAEGFQECLNIHYVSSSHEPHAGGWYQNITG